MKPTKLRFADSYPEARQILSEDGAVGLRCTVGNPDKESLLRAPSWGADGTIADIEGRNECPVGGDDWDRLAEFLGDPDGQIGTGPQGDGFVGAPIGEVDEERLAALLADPPEPTPALRALLDSDMKTIRIACPKYARLALAQMGYIDPHSLGNHGTMSREMSERMEADARAARADVLVSEEVARVIQARTERFWALVRAELDALARPKAERPLGRVGDLQRLLDAGELPADPSGYVQTEPQWLDVEPEDVWAGRIAKRAGRPAQRCSLAAPPRP